MPSNPVFSRDRLTQEPHSRRSSVGTASPGALCLLVALTLLIMALPLEAQIGSAPTAPARARQLPVTQQADIVLQGDSLETLSGLALSGSGKLALAGGFPVSISIFDASTGKRTARLGGRGGAPRLYSVSGMQWTGDTLVYADGGSRQVAYYSLNESKMAATFPVTQGTVELYQAGKALVGAVLEPVGPSQPSKLYQGTIPAPVGRSFFALSPKGLGPAFTTVRDSTQPDPLQRCADSAETIFLMKAIDPSRGPLVGVQSNGTIVAAARDGFSLSFRRAGSPQRRFEQSNTARPATPAVWNSVAAEYLELTREHGPLACEPVVARPTNLRVVRALRVDNSDRIWVEVTDKEAGDFVLLSPQGQILGRVTLPPSPLPRLGWWAWNNHLYEVLGDNEHPMRLRVFDVMLK